MSFLKRLIRVEAPKFNRCRDSKSIFKERQSIVAMMMKNTPTIPKSSA